VPGPSDQRGVAWHSSVGASRMLRIRESLKPHSAGVQAETPFGKLPARLADSEPRTCMPSAYGSNKYSGMDGGVRPHDLLKPSRQFPHQLGHMLSSSHTRTQGTCNLFLDSSLYPSYMHFPLRPCIQLLMHAHPTQVLHETWGASVFFPITCYFEPLHICFIVS
jgi:hypothetical protein